LKSSCNDFCYLFSQLLEEHTKECVKAENFAEAEVSNKKVQNLRLKQKELQKKQKEKAESKAVSVI